MFPNALRNTQRLMNNARQSHALVNTSIRTLHSSVRRNNTMVMNTTIKQNIGIHNQPLYALTRAGVGMNGNDGNIFGLTQKRHVGGPAARLLVQIIVMAGGVVIKAFGQAIAQAKASK